MQTVHHPGPHNEESERPLGTKPLIHPSATVLNSRMGEYTEVDAQCFCKEISLGDYSYLSSSVRAIWCDIGKFSSIASHCVINPGNHPYTRVTQSHCTYRRRQYGLASADDAGFFEWRKKEAVHIGHDVWMGHGVYVMPGARIGIGAVVAAGSVVTKKHPVEPYTIAAGAPAKSVKRRFSKTICEKLLEIAFWDWEREEIKAALEDFNHVESFIEKYGT